MQLSKKIMLAARNHPMRVVFFLGSHFGVLFLKKIRSFKNLDFRVVTYCEESDEYYGYESVAGYCKKNHIPFLDASSDQNQALNFCASHNPDFILCGYYAKILPEKIFNLAKNGAFNIHPGKLPQYRGPFPTAWAILNNEKEIGITIHQIDRYADTGPIVSRKTHAIKPDETGYELYKRSMGLAAGHLASFLPRLLKKKFNAVDQSALGSGSYYGKIASHQRIEWKENAVRIKNLVRVHAKPYFPVYSFIKNKMILVNRCRISKNSAVSLQGPRKILEIASDQVFFVSCGDGVIKVTDYEICPLNREDRKEKLIKKGLQLF